MPYYEAFQELTTCRPVDAFTGSVGRIPWTALDAYARRQYFFEGDFERFCYYIKVLDEKLLQLIKDNKPKPGKPKDREALTPGSRK